MATVPSMTNDLIRWTEERLNADPDLDVDIGILVLAALEGDADLDDYLHGRTASHPSRARSTEGEPMPKAKLAFASFSRCTEDFARLVRRSEEQDWRLIVDYGHDYG